ncbi:MAG TPA: hypothetical protein VFR13_10650 [Jiangellaceae bacterium]|nr:hypothetical protein [Jiangellaceae bacterium]
MSTTPPGPYDNADRPEGSQPDQPATDPFAQPSPGPQPPSAPSTGSTSGDQPAYPPMPPPPPLQYESPGAAAAPAAPPPSLLTAVRLMYVGAALSATFLVLGLVLADSLRDQIADEQPDLSATELDAAVAISTAFAVIIGLLSVGLWIWMAVMNRKGRSWARVVATVLGGLNILFTLISIAVTQNTGIGTIVNLISIVLAAAILWLLYRPESSAYYAAMSEPRR